MKFSKEDAARRGWEGLDYWVYNSKEQFANLSSAYFEVTGSHGPTKTTVSDRVYFVIDGEGEFVLEGETTSVQQGDVMVVPKNTEYDFRNTSESKLKLFLVHTPAFDIEGEVKIS